MKEELTSSTDQESPNSTGTDVEQPPPDILPQYGPSIVPTNKSPREASTEKQPIQNRQQKAEVDPAYYGDDDDQYTGSTEGEETDEYWSKGRPKKQKCSSPPKPKNSDCVKDTGMRNRQMGFFDVFASFLQSKEKEVEEENLDTVVKENERSGRPQRSKSESKSKPEYIESSEGEDLGEFRVETADPTVLKISRISPGSRTPVHISEPKTETPIPEPQPHMVASTNGTVVTLRRISSTKPNVDPVHNPSDHESTNPKSNQDGKYEDADVKTELMDVYHFTDNEAETKDTDTFSESQDTNSGNYTLRKRKKVNFNLLAEGNLNDDDFIPDPPEIKKKSGEFIESPHKKNGRARKKKPFDKAHFMNYNRRLLRLRKGVCVLLETLFPEMIYPRRFNPESHAVDYLIDHISNIVQDKELPSSSRMSRCYGDLDWDVTILLCSTPKDCLRHLRRRIMKLLKALLPGLKTNRYFDHSSASVDALVEEITFVNAQHLSSQATQQTASIPSELTGATPSCSNVAASQTKTVGLKRKLHDSNASDHSKSAQGDSGTQVSPTAKHKRSEQVDNSESLMPPPVAPAASSFEEAPTKKPRKNPLSASSVVDEPQPSTSTGSIESTTVSML